jgi:hypothetical protein
VRYRPAPHDEIVHASYDPSALAVGEKVVKEEEEEIWVVSATPKVDKIPERTLNEQDTCAPHEIF